MCHAHAHAHAANNELAGGRGINGGEFVRGAGYAIGTSLNKPINAD